VIPAAWSSVPMPLLFAFETTMEISGSGGVGDTLALVRALRRVSVEAMLFPVLIQLAVILLAARLFSRLFRRFRQPGVIGEIAAGLVLGPSVLGGLFPEVAGAIFQPTLHVAGTSPELQELFGATLSWILDMVAQLGLILLLFLVGLEFDFRQLKKKGGSVAVISAAGILLPFALGMALAWFMYSRLDFSGEGAAPPPVWGFALFMGTAISITALPVLGRMMLELNITRTGLGTVVMASAALNDTCGWILLAAVTAVAGGDFQAGQTLLMFGETALFAFLMLGVARPYLCRLARESVAQNDGELRESALAIWLVVLFACAIVTNLIGIFAIFGAFLLGAVLSSESAFRDAINHRLRDFVTVFFLPIFFTYTGLRTEIGTLASIELWGLCGLVLATAIFGKLFGCGVAARLTGYSSRESACVGAMMNTRGLMELVVINIGYDLRVIPRSVYCMLVIMALVTTVMTTPLILRLMRGTEFEDPIRKSGFLGTGS
jgi:Kef-type K+ transport system membrane component KefB